MDDRSHPPNGDAAVATFDRQLSIAVITFGLPKQKTQSSHSHFRFKRLLSTNTSYRFKLMRTTFSLCSAGRFKSSPPSPHCHRVRLSQCAASFSHCRRFAYSSCNVTMCECFTPKKQAYDQTTTTTTKSTCHKSRHGDSVRK